MNRLQSSRRSLFRLLRHLATPRCQDGERVEHPQDEAEVVHVRVQRPLSGGHDGRQGHQGRARTRSGGSHEGGEQAGSIHEGNG